MNIGSNNDTAIALTDNLKHKTHIVTRTIYRQRIAYLIALLLLSPLSYATESLNYLAIKGGLAHPKNPGGNAGVYAVNATYIAGAAVGRVLSDILSLEIEYMHRGQNIFRYSPSPQLRPPVSSTWPARSDAVMLNSNIYLTKSSIKPYVKIGIGISRNKTSTYQVPDEPPSYYDRATINKLAWQIGVGINFYASESMDAVMEYTLTNHGKIMSGQTNRSKLGETQSTPRNGLLIDNIAIVGLKFKF